MKRKFITGISMFVLVFMISFSSAQMGGGMMGDQKGDMPKGMMGEEMMNQDMMQMMMGMMDMQEKMMKGANPSEKKQMMRDMAKMKDKMHKMMSMGMMAGAGSQKQNIKCAEEWLKKAIDLHEVHIKDPMTATEASQHEMMDQMKKAYGCITGTGSEMNAPSSGKPATGEKKKDAHGH